MNLFTARINNWSEWGKLFQDIETWQPLIKYIFQKENLPFFSIENLKPGTNAVFKVGDYVIKIYAPQKFGVTYGTNADVELFGLKLANKNGVPSPKLIANGIVSDKFEFRYIIMEYISGKMLGEIMDNLSYDDKVNIGIQVRNITDKLNVPCKNFSQDVLMEFTFDSEEWKKEEFPDSFLLERLEYLKGVQINENEKVYCHIDFHVENVLVDYNMNIYLIDFADGMLAPALCEQAYIVSALFCFEKPYMTGYFGEYDVADLEQWENDGWDVSQWNLQPLADDIKLLLQEGLDYIFFDYPFGYMQKQISEFISLSVFLDTPLDIAMARRLLRNELKEKSKEELKEHLEWYLKSGHKLFELSNYHQRNDAELIVDGSLPLDNVCDLILDRMKML